MNISINVKQLLFIFSLGLFLFFWVWTNPQPKIKGTIKIYDRHEQLLYEQAGQVGHQEWISLDKIPRQLQQAVILTEDERFYQHFGLDFFSLIRAIIQNLKAGKIVSGASTIPQQLVRFTVISPQKPAPLNLVRKLREMLMAIRLSLTSSKKTILERYLNVMHFGRQTFGVKAASRLYFDQDVSQLSLAQSALLAGLIANPSQYDPISQPQTCLERRNLILKKMFEKKIIDQEEFDRAEKENLPTTLNPPPFSAPHVVDIILNKIEPLKLKTKNGLKIYTTIDLNWQKLVEKIAQRQVDQLYFKHNLSNASVVIIENETSQIITLLGSVDYFDQTIEGQNNMATALRQPGSALKPVTYAAAFAQGLATPATVIEDIPKVYLTKKGEGFMPHNFDGQYRGPVLVREALGSSYNLPAVEMLSRVGLENFLDLTYKMGISSLQQTDRYDLALTLGGGEVSLLELTNLFAVFARAGQYLPTQLIDRIETDENKLIYQPKKSPAKSVLDEKIAWLITDILSDTKARIPSFGEKNPLVLEKPAAAKTGTTTDWHDNWTVGYTVDYTVGVWVGNSNNKPMKDITGITGAAPIWRQVFSELLKFMPYTEFEKPEEIIQVEICRWDGLLPTESCPEKYLESFIQGTEPTEYTSLTQRPKTSLNQEQIQIINPRHGAVFEIGTRNPETIVFEITPSDTIESITWSLDNKALDCQASCLWTPKLGVHKLEADVFTKEGIKLNLSPVEFEVIEYKKGW